MFYRTLISVTTLAARLSDATGPISDPKVVSGIRVWSVSEAEL